MLLLGEKSSTGLLEWDSKSDAVEALILCNHTPVDNPSQYTRHQALLTYSSHVAHMTETLCDLAVLKDRDLMGSIWICSVLQVDYLKEETHFYACFNANYVDVLLSMVDC